MTLRSLLFAALFVISAQAQAWIAYGFQSGMSRFSVEGHLVDDGLLVTTGSDGETLAGPEESRARYQLAYCSSPQKLFRMRYRLADSRDVFDATRHKFERRYGTPDSSGELTDSASAEDWRNTDVSLIWQLNQTETILLEHDRDGTIAEFQDLSVCQ